MKTPAQRKYSRVYIEITNCCNLSCHFCCGTIRPKEYMSRPLFEKIIDQSCGIADNAVFHVLGEPLLHPELDHFLEYSHNKGMGVIITTNGTLLGSDVGDYLLGDRVQTLNISLHAFESVEDNDVYLETVLAFAERSIRAGSLNLINLRLWNAFSDEGDGVLNKINSFFGSSIIAPRALSELKKDKSRAVYKVSDRLNVHFDTRFQWPDLSLPVISDSGFCYGLGSHFGILVDATVVPCCLDAKGVIALGNLHDQSLEEILACERAVHLREGFNSGVFSEDLCKRCGYAARFIRKTRFHREKQL